jgi:hypothetical protein
VNFLLKKDNRFLNEEDSKYKIIHPYIQSLGFSYNELKFEENFTIRLGKNSWDPNKKFDIQKGRLDILCKRNGMNLFIIEVKAENIKISQDDIDQGISYARLLDYIAPFVLITNGKETFVYDSIEKKMLNGENIGEQSTFWKNGCKLATEEDLYLRYEALKNFIGYSNENIKEFSHLQIEDRMTTLKGSRNDLIKKYIPELFVERKSLYRIVEQFIDSTYSAFALIGESGVGKTNYICDLAEKLASNYISLFYNAAFSYKPILEEICDDFNWAFSSLYDPSEIFKRLESIVSQGKTKVLIFIDAIDESSYTQVDQDLNDFCRKIKHFPHIKLFITCKITEWDRFLSFRGTPTYLKESLFPVDIIPGEKENTVKTTIPGFVIKHFSDEELELLQNKYREVYKFKGGLTNNLKEDCKLGFMLRIIAEVYSNKKLPFKVDDINLLTQYLEQKLEKINRNDADSAKQFLSMVGQSMVDQEISGQGLIGKVLESDFKVKHNLKVTDKIPIDLYSFNLLTKTELINGNVYIGFYYTRLRDFIISHYSFKLPDLNDIEFEISMNKLLKCQVGQGALRWYTNKANENQKKIMFNTKTSQALILLNEYERLIDENFLAIKDQFSPKTLEKIGIVITSTNTPLIDMYGFRPIQDEIDKNVIAVEPLTDNFFKYGVDSVKSFGGLYFEYAPLFIAKNAISSQIKGIIKKGLLNEESSIPIIIEMVLVILYFYGEKLNIFSKTQNFIIPRYTNILPINLYNLLDSIKLFFARYYYKEEQLEEHIKKGRIKVEKKGTSSFYHYDDSIFDYKEIERKAHEAVKYRIKIIIPNVKGDFPPYVTLYKLVLQRNLLLEKSIVWV